MLEKISMKRGKPMKHKPKLQTISICVAVVALLIPVNSYGVEPDAGDAAPDTASSGSTALTFSPEEVAATQSFWNSPLMRNANVEPMPLPELVGAPSISGDSTRGIAAQPTAYQDTTTRSVGRLNFTQSGVAHSCTASFVNSSSRKLLVTAAHCLHGGKGRGWYDNFMFFPDYPEGQQGLPISTVRVFDDWKNGARDEDKTPDNLLKSDVGFATIDTSVLSGSLTHPADLFGANDFGHSGLTSFSARVVGYPASPGGAEVRMYFTALTGAKPLVADGIEIGNGFSDPHGSSGSPWLQLYNSSTGTGWVNGVVASTGGGKLYSPRFTDRVYTMFNTANQDR
jgi:hypothetical protein